MSPIRVVRGSRFSASTRTVMPRSVTSPLSRPSVSSSTVPTPCCFIARAAADTASAGAMQTGAGYMISCTFLTVLHLLLIRLRLPPVAHPKRASQRRCGTVAGSGVQLGQALGGFGEAMLRLGEARPGTGAAVEPGRPGRQCELAGLEGCVFHVGPAQRGGYRGT